MTRQEQDSGSVKTTNYGLENLSHVGRGLESGKKLSLSKQCFQIKVSVLFFLMQMIYLSLTKFN